MRMPAHAPTIHSLGGCNRTAATSGPPRCRTGRARVEEDRQEPRARGRARCACSRCSPLALPLLGPGGAGALIVYGPPRAVPGAGGCLHDPRYEPAADQVCPGAAAGLAGAQAVAVSPDGTSVYVAGGDDVVALARDPASGGLSPALSPSARACISSSTSSPCARKDGALSGADTVAVSPDGRFVYLGASNSAAVSAFIRGRGGVLVPLTHGARPLLRMRRGHTARGLREAPLRCSPARAERSRRPRHQPGRTLPVCRLLRARTGRGLGRDPAARSPRRRPAAAPPNTRLRAEPARKRLPCPRRPRGRERHHDLPGRAVRLRRLGAERRGQGIPAQSPHGRAEAPVRPRRMHLLRRSGGARRAMRRDGARARRCPLDRAEPRRPRAIRGRLRSGRRGRAAARSRQRAAGAAGRRIACRRHPMRAARSDSHSCVVRPRWRWGRAAASSTRSARAPTAWSSCFATPPTEALTPAGESPTAVNSLSGPAALALSPDGRSIYVASPFDEGVAGFMG